MSELAKAISKDVSVRLLMAATIFDEQQTRVRVLKRSKFDPVILALRLAPEGTVAAEKTTLFTIGANPALSAIVVLAPLTVWGVLFLEVVNSKWALFSAGVAFSFAAKYEMSLEAKTTSIKEAVLPAPIPPKKLLPQQLIVTS